MIASIAQLQSVLNFFLKKNPLGFKMLTFINYKIASNNTHIDGTATVLNQDLLHIKRMLLVGRLNYSYVCCISLLQALSQETCDVSLQVRKIYYSVAPNKKQGITVVCV
jgi:hypothetical protein